jgi:hypothetical protein
MSRYVGLVRDGEYRSTLLIEWDLQTRTPIGSFISIWYGEDGDDVAESREDEVY